MINIRSVWTEGYKTIGRESLKQDINTDVAVIGGGMAGILTAYLLKEKGANAVVIEAAQVGGGVTQNTTAKITSQHNLIYDKLLNSLGEEKAEGYAKANQSAIKKFKEIISAKNIDCDFEDKPAYVYAKNDTESIENEIKAAQKLGINAEYSSASKLPISVGCAVKFPDQAQFHPLKFIHEIAKELTIYENTLATDIKENVIFTGRGKIKAEKIVMATHYPFINTPGYYFARMHQERSYVLALENAGDVEGMYIDAENDGFSFRNYKNLLLLGGSSHRTGENKQGGKYAELRTAAKIFYPGSQEKYNWSAQDAMTLDAIPYIGQFSASTPGLYVATGFNKWGMTSSMVSAMILSDMITDKQNPYEEVFTPQRFNAALSVKNLFSDIGHSISGYAAGTFHLPDEYTEDIAAGHAEIVDFDGSRVGVYKDMDGTLYMVSSKCPHLGCELSWNTDELSWDCPCHGSRFDYEGNLINNPALKGIFIAKHKGRKT